jgi:hypothetical protein
MEANGPPPNDPPRRTVRMPTEEERETAFAAYALAVGRVAYAWNFLHGALGQLFVLVNGAERQIALAVWYSTESDRGQRRMLQAAAEASTDDRWPIAVKAKGDIEWMVKETNKLAEHRNTAVHAAAALHVGVDGVEMGPNFWNGSPRAARLLGKKLLAEFEWCEQCVREMTWFVNKAETALAFPETYPWPERPDLPKPPSPVRPQSRATDPRPR